MFTPPHTDNVTNSPRLFAHRGSSLLAPENTTAAFDLALGFQSDVLETDVRLSKDGVVMVTHDETLQRTTDASGRVRDYYASELKQFNAACRFIALEGKPYQGNALSLLTLNELFEHYPNVGINIDIKDNDQAAATAVATVIKNVTKHHSQWVNVGSFHAPVIKRFRALAPQVSTSATRGEVARIVFGSAKRIEPDYQLLQIPARYWGIQLTGKRLINKVHKLNCKLMYWTINDPAQMRRLLEKGCDGIVTDRPDLAIKEFERFRSIMS